MSEQGRRVRIQAGDEQAFMAFVAEHDPAVYALALGYLPEPDGARALATRSWQRFLRTLGRIDAGTALHVHLCRQVLAAGRALEGEAANAPRGPQLPLQEQVRSLPEAQRVLVTLRDRFGWSDADACQVLKVSVPEGRAALHAGRQQIRRERVGGEAEAVGAA